jgi:secondary thiamine-phosphate synthase enzyme
MQFTLKTQGNGDFHNITDKVEEAVTASKIRNGIVCAFVGGTTAGMTIIDDEEGHKEDLRRMLEKLAPKDGHYEHNTPGDRNGHAHVRCALMGVSVSIPIVDGELVLGTWQKIFVVDFDSRERERPVTITVV